VPWLFKFLWGPLVDRYGTRRRWLLGSVCSLGVVCLAGATHLPVTLTPVALVLLLLNLFASIQDVAVDAIAISLLKPEELALGNTAQVRILTMNIYLMKQVKHEGLYIFVKVRYMFDIVLYVYVNICLDSCIVCQFSLLKLWRKQYIYFLYVPHTGIDVTVCLV